MKTLPKVVFGSLLLAGAAVAMAAPAEARVGVEVNLGFFAPAPPVFVPAPAPAYALPAYCYGPYYYANCAYSAWGEPVFWNGYWYTNPRYRFVRGRREFWVEGGWHADIRFDSRGHHRR